MTASLSKWWLDRTGVNLACLLASLALCAFACRSSDNAPAPDRTLTAIRQALKSGSYVEAERLASASKLQLEVSSRGGIRYAHAVDLLVEALMRNGKAGEPPTLALAQRAIELKKHIKATDLELARSSELLGSVHTERGEFTSAIPHHERALAIRQQELGANHTLVADSLDHLARALIRLERFTDARRSLDQSVAIRESVKNEPLAQARTFELLGLLRRYEGAYPIALEALRRSLDLQKRFAPEHPDLASILQIRGDLLWLQGKIDEGRRSWADALSHTVTTLGEAHPSAAPILRKLALAAEATGDLAEGRRLRERGLNISEASLAPCHPERSNLLSDLALSLIHDGEYAGAQKKYDLALALYKKCLGERHSLVATAIYNQADLAAKMGDFNEAAQLYQSAIDLWSAVLGSDHPYVARALDGLAETHAKRAQYGRAQELYARALKIRRASGGPSHPDVAWTLTNMASAVGTAGDVQRAVGYASEAVDIYKRTGVGDEPDHLARALELRAIHELRLGRGASAKTNIMEALELRRKTFGETHPLTAGTLVQLARVEFASAERARAMIGALDAEEMARDHLRFTIRYLPERQAMAYANARARGLDLSLSILATGSPTPMAGQVFDAVIRSRGIVLDEMAARAQLISKIGVSATPATLELHGARQRFANLVLRSLQANERVSAAVLAAARRNKEQAERAVADLSAAARPELTERAIGLREVRRALPAGSALVSFVKYTETRMSSGKTGSASGPTASYIAFIARSDRDSISIKVLGSTDSVERLVSQWRTQVMQLRSEREVRIAGQRLYKQTWAPLKEHLDGMSRVFIVPDGALNLVNFGALPSGASRYLVDEAPLFHYLSTERDLVTATTPDAPGGLLAVGGVEFEPIAESSLSGRAISSRASHMYSTDVTMREAGCVGQGSLKFEPLTGTAQEVSHVGRLWSSFQRSLATVLTGTAANEGAIREASAGREVIHFATHAFFLGSSCRSVVAGTRAVGGLSIHSGEITDIASENPLAAAGLAFAGANHHGQSEGSDDGILTAEEVAGLNLQGTRWAVLSACDTGVGQVNAGEGVFGLRRAFQIAGARTVVMSLWSVEDQATREWMSYLYEGRLRDKLDTAASVTVASRRFLASRRERQLSTHPFYWAAFVAAGDWH